MDTNTILATGQKLKFINYGQLEAGMEPILQPGDIVTVAEPVANPETGVADGSEGYVVTRADGATDNIFYPEEAELHVDAPAPRARAARGAATKAAPAAATKGIAAPAGGDAAQKAAEKTAKAAEAKAKKEADKAAKLAAKEADKAAKLAAKDEADKKSALALVDTDGVAESLKSHKDALAAAKAIVHETEERFFTLGGVLAHILYEKLYTKLGHVGQAGFAEYIKTELDIDYRKAMYLINIYTHFTALGISESAIVEMGWSKAKELVGVVKNKTQFKTLSKFALSHSKDELIDHIRTEYKSADAEQTTAGATPRRRDTFKFRAFEDQASNVKEIVELVAKDITDGDMDAAFVHIITEWAMLTEGTEVPLETALENLEKRYKVKVAVA